MKLTSAEHRLKQIIRIDIHFIYLTRFAPNTKRIRQGFLTKTSEMSQLYCEPRCINLSKMNSFLLTVCTSSSRELLTVGSGEKNGPTNVGQMIIFQMVFGVFGVSYHRVENNNLTLTVNLSIIFVDGSSAQGEFLE